MKKLSIQYPNLLFSALLAFCICSCEVEDNPPKVVDDEVADSPHTEIPEEFVGTWFADHNDGPLSDNWEQGAFQGEQGFREFRTLVFTKNGKNAIEYTTEISNVGDEEKKRFYKLTGTLEYKSNPASITFHAQSGKMRVFSNKYAGYQESDIVKKDIMAYTTVLLNPEATTFSSSTNYLNAKLLDGTMQLTVKYRKVGGGTGTPGGGTADPYAAPPATGTYVQIGSQYYPTVRIGNLEWMSANYAGAGGIKDAGKPQYGTYYKYADLKDIQIPEGWRMPTKQDYLNLLQSQGIAFDEVWETTDGSDLQSKKLLGQLMATTGWLKLDGYASNKSGFNAVPANLRVSNGNPQGEGANCLLWTANSDAEENPVAFKIIQLPSDTYASFGPYITGFNPPHLPVRFVRQK
ncbi:FISUMP domain-containing protein [Pontibacter beigongshangensis]|uniref:FISUMP domain-containing protein n=1 Tax=Pontibacter beigongshangensis TaxID=2574733 RepID=UPI001650C4A6|nr:FISUMP domain-containing protein [Pontibacter beigongshangensis]